MAGETGDVLLQVRNHHTAEAGTPPRIDDAELNHYVGYFENAYGEQAVFVFDRASLVAERSSWAMLGGSVATWSSMGSHPTWCSMSQRWCGCAPAGRPPAANRGPFWNLISRTAREWLPICRSAHPGGADDVALSDGWPQRLQTRPGRRALRWCPSSVTARYHGRRPTPPVRNRDRVLANDAIPRARRRSLARYSPFAGRLARASWTHLFTSACRNSLVRNAAVACSGCPRPPSW